MIRNSTLRLTKDRRGASSAEYALLLALVGAGIILASFALGVAVSGSMNDAASNISQ
jgi:pilus assembly protein Flp/PilA